MPELSIIIPCYNCEATLKDAVASCYRQDLKEFEIVLVDDGSRDGTRTIIETLSSAHPEIRAIYHTENRGGGAARNTGATNAQSATLFFLDSDDLLPDGTLRRMLDYKQAQNVDAVGIARSIKFRGTDVTNIDAEHVFARSGERIVLDDLLEKDGLCALYSTFMLSAKAFENAGGYPTHHGFDTQGFAWRFLASGGTAMVCPGAEYLHRVGFHASYYVREVQDGRVNYNWFEILDEHVYLLPKEARVLLLSFPYDDTTQNLFDRVRAVTRTLGAFPDRASFVATFESIALDGVDAYSLASTYLRTGQYDRARALLRTASEKTRSRRCTERLQALTLIESGEDEEKAFAIVAKTRKLHGRNSLQSLFYRARTRMKNYAKKNTVLKDILLAFHFADQDIRARIASKHAFSLIGSWVVLKLETLFKYRFVQACTTDTPLDVVIPTIAKDRFLLSAYLSSLRENLCGTIGTIYVVAPEDALIRAFCTDEGLTFIDERSVLGYGKEKIEYTVGGLDRRGWLFQQLLKLSGDRFITGERYVIVDSDTLLIRPHAFIENGKQVFVESVEWNEPYFRSFERLFGYEAPNRRSLTAHMMLFEVAHLKEMKEEIERRSGTTWDRAYIKAADRSKPSGISDYDTYANWVLKNHPKDATTRPFYNKSLSRSTLDSLEALKKRYRGRYSSLSFHSYNA